MMPHNPLGPICTAATVHFSAAVANFSWLECRATPTELYYLGFDDAEIFPVHLKVKNAHYTVPDVPGLGIEVNEERLTAESFKFWEAPTSGATTVHTPTGSGVGASGRAVHILAPDSMAGTHREFFAIVLQIPRG